MNLLTDELKLKFEEDINGDHPLSEDAIVLAHYFNPNGSGDWLITKGTKDGDDYLLFGYMKITFGEFGYVLLSELQALIETGILIERNLYLSDNIRTVRDLKRIFCL